MTALVRFLNALLILILATVLLAALVVQYYLGEQPCPLCMLQRLGMIGIATGALLNLRFGVNAQHYALAIFYTVCGGGIALRQIALHVCPGFTTFGEPVLGLSLYTWSFLVSVCSVLYIALLLLLYPASKEDNPPAMNRLEKGAFAYLALICLANVYSAFTLCGLGPCADA